MPDIYDTIAAEVVRKWISTLAPMIAEELRGAPNKPAPKPNKNRENVLTLNRAFTAKIADEWPDVDELFSDTKINGGAADLLLTGADINLVLVVMTTAMANEAMIGRDAPSSPSFCKALLLDEMARAADGRPSRVLPQKIDGTTKGKADEETQPPINGDDLNPINDPLPAQDNNSGGDIPAFLDRRGENNGGTDQAEGAGNAEAKISAVVEAREAKLKAAGFSRSRIRSLGLENMAPEDFRQFLLEEGIE